MRELKTAIKATMANIKVTKAALKAARDPEEIDFLRARDLQLGANKLALRKELASACTSSRLFPCVFKHCYSRCVFHIPCTIISVLAMQPNL